MAVQNASGHSHDPLRYAHLFLLGTVKESGTRIFIIFHYSELYFIAYCCTINNLPKVSAAKATPP